MPELTNSTRRIDKATHVTIEIAQQDDGLGAGRGVALRGVDKVQFIRALAITTVELRQVLGRLAQHGEDAPRVSEQVVGVIRDMAVAQGATHNLRYARHLAPVSYDQLRAVAVALAAVRRDNDRYVQATLKDIAASYASVLAREAPATVALSGAADAGAWPDLADAAVMLPASGETGPASDDGGHAMGPTLSAALQWAIETDDPRVARLRSSGHLVYRTAWMVVPLNRADKTNDIIESFDRRMRIEPVGRLHLERLAMVPAGIERGELQYSLALAPKEVAHFSHKEWSTQSEEFERIVQDAFEEYSETGVAEKKELSQATDSQQRHSSAYSLSGSYSYAGQVKISVGAKRSAEDVSAQQARAKQSKELTGKASTRTTKDHKQSFKVESVVGSEDTAARSIENPSSDKPMRLDYYEMVRKWRVDLFRHDVRLTYDIVIPSPGDHLMARVDELRMIDEQLDEPFAFPLTLDDH